MGKVSLNDAKAVVSRLVLGLNPKAVLVFGSVARGSSGNDLDLLVIFEENGKSLQNLDKEIGRNLKNFYENFGIDYFVVDENRLKELWRSCSAFLGLILKEGRIFYMKNADEIWLKYAREDLGMAHSLFKDKYYKGACYHGEQALEKALKGLLIKQGWELEKTHSIRYLLTIGKRYDLQFDFQEEMINFAESIYRGRYPEMEGLLPGGEPSEEETKNLLSSIEDFFRRFREFKL